MVREGTRGSRVTKRNASFRGTWKRCDRPLQRVVDDVLLRIGLITIPARLERAQNRALGAVRDELLRNVARRCCVPADLGEFYLHEQRERLFNVRTPSAV